MHKIIVFVHSSPSWANWFLVCVACYGFLRNFRFLHKFFVENEPKIKSGNSQSIFAYTDTKSTIQKEMMNYTRQTNVYVLQTERETLTNITLLKNERLRFTQLNFNHQPSQIWGLRPFYWNIFFHSYSSFQIILFFETSGTYMR